MLSAPWTFLVMIRMTYAVCICSLFEIREIPIADTVDGFPFIFAVWILYEIGKILDRSS